MAAAPEVDDARRAGDAPRVDPRLGASSRCASRPSIWRRRANRRTCRRPGSRWRTRSRLFDETIARARAALVTTTDLELAQLWTLKKGGAKVLTAPRGSVLRSFVLNHGVHHRAQLGLYLRMLDVPVPAMYGPTADTK